VGKIAKIKIKVAQGAMKNVPECRSTHSPNLFLRVTPADMTVGWSEVLYEAIN